MFLKGLQMKKYIICALCFVVALATGLGIYFSLPKEVETVEFKFTAQNINVNVGEKQKLNYTVSVPDAIISVNITDRSIAKVIFENNNIYIQGCAKGETEMSLTASYKGETKKDSVNVQVSSNEIDNGIDEDPETPSDDSPDQPSNIEDGGSNNENSSEDLNDTDETTNTEITLYFSNEYNCTVEDNVIKVLKSSISFVSISANINFDYIDIEFVDAELSSLVQDLGNKTFQFYSDEVGEFEFYVIIDSNYKVKCKLVVE